MSSVIVIIDAFWGKGSRNWTSDFSKALESMLERGALKWGTQNCTGSFNVGVTHCMPIKQKCGLGHTVGATILIFLASHTTVSRAF